MGLSNRITTAIDRLHTGKYAILIVLVALLGPGQLNADPPHDFHVSRCEINFRPASKSLEITQQVFVDDFEEALKAIFNDAPLHIGTDQEHAEADKFIVRYLSSKFHLKANGESRDFVYLGKELSEDLMSLWIYIEIEDVDPHELAVEFSVLFELFDDQKNILSFRVDQGRERMFLLDIGRPGVDITVQ